jgi:hypothetical protein
MHLYHIARVLELGGKGDNLEKIRLILPIQQTKVHLGNQTELTWLRDLTIRTALSRPSRRASMSAGDVSPPSLTA